MPSGFTNAEKILFDEFIEGFEPALVAAKAAELYDPFDNGEEAARAGDRFWVQQPMISSTFDGFDQTSNFRGINEGSVPVDIGYHKVDPITLTSKEMRVESALRRRFDATKRKLAADVNMAVLRTAALQGSVFVKRTGQPTGYDDVAMADAAMTEVGVPTGDRQMLLAPRVYNAMAGDLAKRVENTTRSQDAYSKALISSDIAGFSVYKNDQNIRLAAAGGGATTVNGANQYHVFKTTVVDATGATQKVDNRYSKLKVTAANFTNIKAGDAFTIAGVNSVQMISKDNTGQLQTFRVIGKEGADTLIIAPAIISPEPAGANKDYQNVTAVPANGAAITWLNTTDADISPFFVKGSLLLVPGSYAVDPKDGWNVLRAKTPELGIGITYTRQGEINDLSVKARIELDFGVSLTNPQMAGATLFGQA